MKYIFNPVLQGSIHQPGISPDSEYVLVNYVTNQPLGSQQLNDDPKNLKSVSGEADYPLLKICKKWHAINDIEWDKRGDIPKEELERWEQEAKEHIYVMGYRPKENGKTRYCAVTPSDKREKNLELVEIQKMQDLSRCHWKIRRLNNGRYQVESLSAEGDSNGFLSAQVKNKDINYVVRSKPEKDKDDYSWVWMVMLREHYEAGRGIDEQVTLHFSNGKKNQEYGFGKYDISDRTIFPGKDEIHQVNVPMGVQLTLFEKVSFKKCKTQSFHFSNDQPQKVDNELKKAAAISVQPVITAYPAKNYEGKAVHFPVGVYSQGKILELAKRNPQIDSIQIPPGMIVYAFFEKTDCTGKCYVLTEDLPNTEVSMGSTFIIHNRHDLGDGKDTARTDIRDVVPLPMIKSLMVSMKGAYVPHGALKFGDNILLQGLNSEKYLEERTDGKLHLSQKEIKSSGEQEFTLIRSGATKDKKYLSYGDIISLRGKEDEHFIEGGGTGKRELTATEFYDLKKLPESIKYRVVRAGKSLNKNFVAAGDTILLQSVVDYYSWVDDSESISLKKLEKKVPNEAKFVITTRLIEQGVSPLEMHQLTITTSGEEPETGEGPSTCGQESCGVDVCGTDYCGLDACREASCSIAAGAIGACGAAASGIAVCGADFAAVSACGAAFSGAGACAAAAEGFSASGASAGGLSACGADVCGAAACGVAACGAAACAVATCGVAAACGAAACTKDVALVEAQLFEVCGADIEVVSFSAADICATEVAVVDACLADACLANACIINLCPADACVADACAIDVVPLIPGI